MPPSWLDWPGSSPSSWLASAHLQAAAIRAEGEAAARGIRPGGPVLESQSRTAAAEGQAANILRGGGSDERNHILAELRQAQDVANATITAMLAEASAAAAGLG